MRAVRRVGLIAAACATVAVAATTDPRGWSEGEVARGASRVLAPLSAAPVEAALPPKLARRITRPTLVVFFSPTCPHCQRVAPELEALHRALLPGAAVIGVATASSTPAELEAFRREYGVTFEVVVDSERDIGAALNVRSTPSAALVRPDDKRLVFVDVWYPYVPGNDTLVRMRLASDPWSVFAPDVYQGNRACGACHVEELESWYLTHHSIAWRTLVEHDDHTNPACTPCHVTGIGAPTGWDGSADSHLVDVGCEACHGPGGPHDGRPTVPASTCEGCHDKKHSIGFRYAKGLPLLDHFRASSMTEARWSEARRALLEGKVDQAMLRFDEGETVGAAACKACHEAEHAQWSTSPHAHAMQTLTTGGAAQDLGCVACHATQRTPGPRASTLEGFRIDEAVGCEACHGPGKAHVDAKGGKDNIVGLGESCPVCVIEAVCTSCHTTTWDADWDLDAALPRASHRAPAAPPVSGE